MDSANLHSMLGWYQVARRGLWAPDASGMPGRAGAPGPCGVGEDKPEWGICALSSRPLSNYHPSTNRRNYSSPSRGWCCCYRSPSRGCCPSPLILSVQITFIKKNSIYVHVVNVLCEQIINTPLPRRESNEESCGDDIVEEDPHCVDGDVPVPAQPIVCRLSNVHQSSFTTISLYRTCLIQALCI